MIQFKDKTGKKNSEGKKKRTEKQKKALAHTPDKINVLFISFFLYKISSVSRTASYEHMPLCPKI